MLYLRCPTCITLLGDKQIYYETRLDELCKKNEMGQFKTQTDFDNARINLVNQLILNKDRYCCKMRLLTYVPLVKIIK